MRQVGRLWGSDSCIWRDMVKVGEVGNGTSGIYFVKCDRRSIELMREGGKSKTRKQK